MAAYSFIALEMARIGLAVNVRKTKVYSPDTSLGLHCAHKLGIAHAPEGIRILGAMISADPAVTEVFLKEKLAEYEKFFARTEVLPAPIAIPVLLKCASSRWVYMMRTHPDSEASVGHAAFEERMLLALCNVLQVDRAHLVQHNIGMIQLPQRYGGLGMALPTSIAHLAYRASSKGGDTQQTLCDEVYRDMQKHLMALHPDIFFALMHPMRWSGNTSTAHVNPHHLQVIVVTVVGGRKRMWRSTAPVYSCGRCTAFAHIQAAALRLDEHVIWDFITGCRAIRCFCISR